MDRYRHEYKYVIDACQRSILLMKVMPVMKPDPYAVQDGSYLVRSLYFDDISDSCLRSNLDGSDPRAKFRLRYYNDDPDRVRLEKKIKRRGMTLKQSCLLTHSCSCSIFRLLRQHV